MVILLFMCCEGWWYQYQGHAKSSNLERTTVPNLSNQKLSYLGTCDVMLSRVLCTVSQAMVSSSPGGPSNLSTKEIKFTIRNYRKTEVSQVMCMRIERSPPPRFVVQTAQIQGNSVVLSWIHCITYRSMMIALVPWVMRISSIPINTCTS